MGLRCVSAACRPPPLPGLDPLSPRDANPAGRGSRGGPSPSARHRGEHRRRLKPGRDGCAGKQVDAVQDPSQGCVLGTPSGTFSLVSGDASPGGRSALRCARRKKGRVRRTRAWGAGRCVGSCTWQCSLVDRQEGRDRHRIQAARHAEDETARASSVGRRTSVRSRDVPLALGTLCDAVHEKCELTHPPATCRLPSARPCELRGPPHDGPALVFSVGRFIPQRQCRLCVHSPLDGFAVLGPPPLVSGSSEPR